MLARSLAFEVGKLDCRCKKGTGHNTGKKCSIKVQPENFEDFCLKHGPGSLAVLFGLLCIPMLLAVLSVCMFVYRHGIKKACWGAARIAAAPFKAVGHACASSASATKEAHAQAKQVYKQTLDETGSRWQAWRQKTLFEQQQHEQHEVQLENKGAALQPIQI
jgi:hypothetical protein